MRISLDWTSRWRFEPLQIRIHLHHMHRSDRDLLITTTNYLIHLQHLHHSMHYEHPNSNIMYQAIRNSMDTVNDLVMTYEDYEELSSLLHAQNTDHHDFDYGSLNVSTEGGDDVLELYLVPPLHRLQNPMVIARRRSTTDIAKAA